MSAVFSVLLAVSGAAQVQAQGEPIIIDTDIILPAPGGTLDKQVEYFAEGKVQDLAQYLGFVYNFLISIVGVVAAVMMIVGGFQYLTSAGDSGKIGEAKDKIANALIGLVLALGAYALLKTINPALVVLQVPGGITGVKTELTFLPYCEDLIKTGTAVEIVVSGTDTSETGYKKTGYCGSIGEFRAGTSTSYCTYRGDADPCIVSSENSPVGGGDMKVPLSCAPAPLNQEEAAAIVAEFRAAKWSNTGPGSQAAWEFIDKHSLYPGGLCSSCASSVQHLFLKKGRPVPPSYCGIFQRAANRGAGFDSGTYAHVKGSNQKFVQYCNYDSTEKTCVGAVIYCKEPVPDPGGCYDGYNEVKDLYYYNQDGKVASWVYGSKRGTLSAHPGHLQNVCFANPCGYNASKGGCTGESGTVNGIRTISTAVRDGIIGIQACDNK